MAQTVTLFNFANDTTAGSIFEWSGDTPSASALPYVLIQTRNTSGAGNPPSPTVSSSGLTWTSAASWMYDDSGVGQWRLDLLRGTGTATSATIYTTYATSVSLFQAAFFEISESSSVVTQTATAPAAANTSSASLEATMAALATNNLVVAMAGIATNDTVTPEAGWTSLYSGAQGNGSFNVFYQVNGSDNTPSASGWTATTCGLLAAEFEYEAPSGPSTAAKHFFLRGIA